MELTITRIEGVGACSKHTRKVLNKYELLFIQPLEPCPSDLVAHWVKVGWVQPLEDRLLQSLPSKHAMVPLFSPPGSSAHCLGRSHCPLITPFSKCEGELLPEQGSQEAPRHQLIHPQPWQQLRSPGSNFEPKNSSVGTGLGKNSLGGHIPASLVAGHQQAHVEPHFREDMGGWTQTKSSQRSQPAAWARLSRLGVRQAMQFFTRTVTVVRVTLGLSHG